MEKVLDHAVRDIRLGHLSRESGIKLVTKHSNAKLSKLSLFFEWLGINQNSFEYIIDQHRNPLFWHRDSNWDLQTSLI